MPLLIERSLLLAKEESTYGTDPTPTAAANAMLVENLQLSFPTDVIDQTPRAKAHMSSAKPLHGRKLLSLSFDVPIKGSGAAGTPPEFEPLLLACGLDVTNVASTSDTYAPASDPNDMTLAPSCTLYVYMDGLLFEANGCRGNVAMSFEAGMRAMLSFSMTGIPVDVVDAALPTPSNLDATDAEIVQSATFTMGGVSDVIQALSIDMQNAVTPADSVNAASAYARIDITARNAAGTFNPEAQLVASRDHWSVWEDGTKQALSIVLGATAGNICTVTAPACYLRELSPGDRNGVLVYDIPITLAADTAAGNDEIAIAFT